MSKSTKARVFHSMTKNEQRNVTGGSIIGGFVSGWIIGSVIDIFLDWDSAVADFNRGRDVLR